MELKKYQEETLRDLAQYIDVLNESNSLSVAYSQYWERRGVSVSGINNDYLRPYINSVHSVPRVTLKVPTAGGKTFIACNQRWLRYDDQNAYRSTKRRYERRKT